jgi:hypothetical protein
MGIYVTGNVTVTATVKYTVKVTEYELNGLNIDPEENIKEVAEEYINAHVHVTDEPVKNGVVINAYCHPEVFEKYGCIFCDFYMDLEEEIEFEHDGEWKLSTWSDDVESEISTRWKSNLHDYVDDHGFQIESINEVEISNMSLEGEADNGDDIEEVA